MKNILMCVSSTAVLGDTGRPTGLWLEELAASYWVFADSGCSITLASPLGGSAPVDPMSLEAPWLTENGQRFMADAKATAALAATKRFADVDPAQFDAVYLVGGAATAWDFPADPELARIVSGIHAAGLPVSGVCHGVLGLTGAKDANGRLLVKDRDVTAVSNAEEVLAGFDRIVPVLPENRLKELGGRYSCAAPFAEHVVASGNLLTGQNPASAGPLASAVLKRIP